ncbi:MAG: prepilin-type N-terminal cleavage/methylation domain-containing protein [Bdellovibrionales bacterium]|nr:prepilin-type N-terminal cleavage/methylation domain-containing protein [Bdellovibrionales bacterium]
MIQLWLMKHAALSPSKGFSLIELMVTVVIIGILSAIAIPTYSNYIRKARTSEVYANLNTIAQLEEAYFTEVNEYITTTANPATVPSDADTSGALSFIINNSTTSWNNLGSVLPNNTNVRFSYRAFAGRFDGSSNPDTSGTFVDYSADLPLDTMATTGGELCDNLAGFSPQDWGVTASPLSNWFVVVAVGNQISDNTCSLFAKVVDQPELIRIQELQ